MANVIKKIARKECMATWVLVQANLIVMISLGCIETDGVLSEFCYNEVIYYSHIAKFGSHDMAILN